MPTTDAVAIFAEGTFEDQVRMCLDVPSVALRANVLQIAELAGYISQSRPEPERAPYIQSIRQRFTVQEGQPPQSKGVERRRQVFSAVFGDVKGLGEGTERGASKFAHPDALSSH
jgi:translation initiation factor 3 subunit M